MDAQGNAVEEEDYRGEYYCPHGRFIGNPYGGDYMCHFCEMGYTDEEYRAHVEYEFDRRVLAALKSEYFDRVLATSVWTTFYHVMGKEAIGQQIAASVREINELGHDELVRISVDELGWVRT